MAATEESSAVNSVGLSPPGGCGRQARLSGPVRRLPQNVVNGTWVESFV